MAYILIILLIGYQDATSALSVEFATKDACYYAMGVVSAETKTHYRMKNEKPIITCVPKGAE